MILDSKIAPPLDTRISRALFPAVKFEAGILNGNMPKATIREGEG